MALRMDSIKPHISRPNPDEIVIRAEDGWLHFSAPERVIVAPRLDQVLPAMHEVERLADANGWYAAGFIGYEAASAFDPAHQTHAEEESEFPFLWFGLYGEPHKVSLPPPSQPLQNLEWRPSVERAAYDRAIARIREQIAEGRTYQVNYTMRLQSPFAGDSWEFFLNLNQTANEHAAYVDTGRYAICSASPELFFQLDGDTITCRPMKGTVKRGRTSAEDREQAGWLRNSEKNRAENVMIVDMVRNDVGRIAGIGTVRVPELFTTERYPTLWQMTSTVTARTKASMTEILAALFPSASITGAPKVSTMRIIRGLETTPRRIYTGSIGYFAPGRRAKFNVAIRTALIDREQGTAEYGTGGGIVWDSTSADEYAEALLKARVLTERRPEFSLLETMLWTPEDGFFLKEKHLARLLDSALYFGYPITRQQLEIYFEVIETALASPHRVRLLLDKDGSLSHTASPLPSAAADEGTLLNVRLAREPVDPADLFLHHKTTHREVYRRAYQPAASDKESLPASMKSSGSETPPEPRKSDDVLLYNPDGELTEFTLGNLVVELHGKLFTPPLSCGLLPGTFRAHLLETGQVAERSVRVEELKDCTRIFRVNSVRKWQRVLLQEHVHKATL